MTYLCVATKGFWAELLGVGNFYYELAVRIIECCILEKKKTGCGLIKVSELVNRLNLASSTAGNKITENDVEQAVKSIKSFGSYQIFTIDNISEGDRQPIKFLQSVPRELNTDVMTLFSVANVLNKLRIIIAAKISRQWV